ncbi:MAG: site-specific integrase [Pelolinea sp.]|nr:site-specific integrase [Pelolinea sp.]
MARRGNNEGSIYKRNNSSWRAQVSVDGERLSFTAETRAECNEWLRRTMDLVDQGMTFQTRNLTLQEYLQGWFQVKKTSVKPKTAYDYERMLNKYINPQLGNIKLIDLTTYQVTRFYTKLIEMEKGSPTVHFAHSVLRSALQDAVRSGIIGRNPSVGALLPRRNQKEMQVLTESQVTQFLITAECSRYKALYHLAITTGMRYSELVGLRWSDIDWEKSTIKVQRQLQYAPHKGFQFSEPKTRSGIRTIMLGETTLKILREHHKKYAHLDKTGENLVFINGIGTIIYFKRFHKDFKRVLRNAGLPDMRFHDLRHTAATLMISNGIPVLIVSKILGHSTPSVTMNIYAHASVEMQFEAARLMENLVTPIPFSLVKEQKQEIST